MAMGLCSIGLRSRPLLHESFLLLGTRVESIGTRSQLLAAANLERSKAGIEPFRTGST